MGAEARSSEKRPFVAQTGLSSAPPAYGTMARDVDETSKLVDESSLGLFDHAFPAEGSPQHTQRRTTASVIVLAFLVIASWTALSVAWDPADAGVSASWLSEMSWIRSSGVSWARGDAAAVAHDAASADALGYSDLEAEDGMNPQLLDDSDLAHVSKQHDFGRYLWHADLAYDPASSGRLIVVGDVHGMVDSLRTLLDKLEYDASVDQLVLAGDLVTKHPDISASLDTIQLARKVGAEAVRGNHDQAVIGWRAWMDIFGDVVGEGIGDDDDASHADSSWLQSKSPPHSVEVKIPKGSLIIARPGRRSGSAQVGSGARSTSRSPAACLDATTNGSSNAR